MTLNLDSELMAIINARVKSGEYSTPEDVVADAVRRLEWDDFAPGELEALCKVGADQADRGELLDVEDVFREIDELQAKAERDAVR